MTDEQAGAAVAECAEVLGIEAAPVLEAAGPVLAAAVVALRLARAPLRCGGRLPNHVGKAFHGATCAVTFGCGLPIDPA